jgi:hypothetical protein
MSSNLMMKYLKYKTKYENLSNLLQKGGRRLADDEATTGSVCSIAKSDLTTPANLITQTPVTVDNQRSFKSNINLYIDQVETKLVKIINDHKYVWDGTTSKNAKLVDKSLNPLGLKLELDGTGNLKLGFIDTTKTIRDAPTITQQFNDINQALSDIRIALSDLDTYKTDTNKGYLKAKTDVTILSPTTSDPDGAPPTNDQINTITDLIKRTAEEITTSVRKINNYSCIVNTNVQAILKMTAPVVTNKYHYY